jgi:hypothetical protein
MGCFGILVSLAMMGVLGYVAWYFLGKPSRQDVVDGFNDFDFGDFSDVLGNLTDADWIKGFMNEDPYVGDNTTNAWQTSGQGLSLELQNALDDLWQTEFEVAVADWEKSDVLTLTTKKVEVDHTCSRVEGVMKVCNGNFGETGWVGLNEAVIQFGSGMDAPGFIVSSVAKMNEYYLNNARYEERRYTMCHEIGHGFGLPHTDENHNNKDLGDCMDYTNTPSNNLLPGDSNFARLRSIYLETSTDDQTQAEAQSKQESVIEEEQVVSTDEANRGLRRVIRTHYLYA